MTYATSAYLSTCRVVLAHSELDLCTPRSALVGTLRARRPTKTLFFRTRHPLHDRAPDALLLVRAASLEDHKGLLKRSLKTSLGSPTLSVLSPRFPPGASDMAVRRVAQRVPTGGHSIPEDVIRRRYERGLENLFSDYLGTVDTWRIVDNTGPPPERLIAWRDFRGEMRSRQPRTVNARAVKAFVWEHGLSGAGQIRAVL